MNHPSNLHDCRLKLLKDWKLLHSSFSLIIFGFFLLMLFSVCSCATSRSATYEHQRRGLLMLEGENIYKNKGFYHSKKSYKQRKKTMRAHKRSIRR